MSYMPYCPRCGREVRPDFRFCPFCGTALTPRIPERPQPLPPPPPPPPPQPAEQPTVSTGETILFYRYIEPYYLYITNRRIAGVKSRMRAFMDSLSPITSTIAVVKDAGKAEQQEKLLRELNTKKKSFEFFWEHVNVIEAKRPGRITGGHIKIIPMYGKSVKINIASGTTFDEVLSAIQKVAPQKIMRTR